MVSSRFETREKNSSGRGGTLGTINWFQGDAAMFYGLRYQIGDKISVSAEYTPDLMLGEKSYLDIESPWNYGVLYKLNDYVDISTQYLHGSQLSLTANVQINPGRPPLLGGKELAPVPMRLRNKVALPVEQSDQAVIRKVLKADRFEIYYLKFEIDTVHLGVKNTNVRSPAQVVGRVASTLQRFTSDKIKIANITFYSQDLVLANYQVDLEKLRMNSLIHLQQVKKINQSRSLTKKFYQGQIINNVSTGVLGPMLPTGSLILIYPLAWKRVLS